PGLGRVVGGGERPPLPGGGGGGPEGTRGAGGAGGGPAGGAGGGGGRPAAGPPPPGLGPGRRRGTPPPSAWPRRPRPAPLPPAAGDRAAEDHGGIVPGVALPGCIMPAQFQDRPGPPSRVAIDPGVPFDVEGHTGPGRWVVVPLGPGPADVVAEEALRPGAAAQ